MRRFIVYFRMRLQPFLFETPAVFGGMPFASPLTRQRIPDDFWQPVPVSRETSQRGQTRVHASHGLSRIPMSRNDDFSQSIPDHFWDPVSPQEAEQLKDLQAKRDNSYRNLRKKDNSSQNTPGDTTSANRVRIIPIEYEGEEYINITDDDECQVLEDGNWNNNGKCLRSRRRSFSESEARRKYLNDNPGVYTGRDSKISDNDTTTSASEGGCLRNGKVRNSREIPVLVEPEADEEMKFESSEEEKQFNELVQFFNDSEVSNSNTSSGQTSKSSSASSRNIMPTPSYPAYDTIRSVIRKEGRMVDYIRGDGNCFFRALSKVIYGSESSHQELRQAVVDLIEKYPREFEQFLDNGTSVHDHIVSMRQAGTWGTQVEIYAAATLLQRDIYVLSPDHTGECYRWLLFSPRFSYPEADTYDKCYITLCHTNGNHYDRIASKSGGCNCGIESPALSGVKARVDLTSSTEKYPDIV